MGCHFLLQCIKVKSESEVAQSCLTLSDPIDCSPPGSSVHGIFQALCPINSISDVFLELIPLLYSHTPLLPTSFPVSFSTLFSFFFSTFPHIITTSYNPWSPSLNPHVTWSHPYSHSQHNSSLSPIVHHDSLAHLALEWRNWHIYFMLLRGFLIFIPQHLIRCLHEEDNKWLLNWLNECICFTDSLTYIYLQWRSICHSSKVILLNMFALHLYSPSYSVAEYL